MLIRIAKVLENALASATGSRKEYQKQIQSQQAYINYLEATYFECSDECIELYAKNDDLLKEIERLKIG